MKHVASTGGVKVALHELGGSGEPLMICHATGFHGRAYQRLADELAGSFTVWALDFRGQGATAPPASGDFAWTSMAQDLMACIAALDAAPMVAVGHSMGASAVMLAELAQPGLIARAYLYEPIVFPQDYITSRTENPLAGPARRRRAVFGSRQEARDRYASRPPLDRLDPASLDAYIEYGFVDTEDGQVTLACEPENEARIFESEDKVTLERLNGLTLRAVVGAGASSSEGPNPAGLAPAIAGAIDGGRLVSYPDLGHFGPLEAPERIAADIIAALTG